MVGTNHLKDAHKNSHSAPAFRKLKQDMETNWNLTYEIIESYMDQHDQVTVALCRSGRQKMCITTDELEVLRKAMATLEPFYDVTVGLSLERHPTVVKFIPLVNILKQMMSCNDSPLVVPLLQHLQERFKTIDKSPHLTMATALDPCYKRDRFPDTGASGSAIQKLKELASAIMLSQCSMHGIRRKRC
ncbi:zinc finger BED domain-containing protein [Elysia marginata]|uniref:Zinc finger BED domain-containing protein n=1 Tax=Elysia marginata TaxID=1093978 RepID=A0AAV4HX65_9GAST|nr:zinc finger BED domain-containing protein [Elysia marginata]